jgi:hypothetical protein
LNLSKLTAPVTRVPTAEIAVTTHNAKPPAVGCPNTGRAFVL